jgi:PAS domain S-box-containing protein
MIEEQEFYWKLLDTLADGVYFANRERKITYWNRGAETITGYRSSEVLGKFCGDNILIHIDKNGNSLCDGPCPLSEVFKSGKTTEAMIYLRHKDGHRLPVFVRVNPVKNKQGEIVGAVEIFSDNSYGNLFQERLDQLKKMDLVNLFSGLPNQRYLRMKLASKFWEFGRYQIPFGIIYVRIGQPKADGRPERQSEAGAEMIKIISSTFSNSMNPLDTIGQWDENEFIAIIGDADIDGLKKTENFYRAIFRKSGFSAAGQGDLILTSSVLTEPGDNEAGIIKRAKDSLRILE